MESDGPEEDAAAAGVDRAGGGVGIGALAPSSRALPRAVKVRVGIGAAVVLAVLAFVAAIVIGMLSPRGETRETPAVAITSARPEADGTRGAGGSSSSPAAASYVHVLGAVARPGLYELAPGARVIDAIAAAGGMTVEADPGAVNLARPIGDGEQLYVSKAGEAPPAGAGGAPGSGAPGGSLTGSGAAGGAKLDLNTATAEDLEELPRVGPATAAKIVDWRTQNGRFASVEDLMNVSGIGQKTFDGLKDRITVR